MPHACPKCRRVQLVAPTGGTLSNADIQGGALRCPACRGLWLPHEVIERWRALPDVEIGADEPQEPAPSGDHRTGLCPHGHGILIRARVDEALPFHLERCPLCRGIWLDAGEWHKLAAHHFLNHIDDLWDPAWQKRQRLEHGRRKLDEALADALGQVLFHELARVIEKLREHPARAQALAWITEHLEE